MFFTMEVTPHSYQTVVQLENLQSLISFLCIIVFFTCIISLFVKISTLFCVWENIRVHSNYGSLRVLA